MSRRTLALVVSASLSAAAFSAPLATIGNEQQGAAAYVTATFATSYTEGTANNMVSDSLIIAEAMLARLSGETTPAALRASPAGITLACANGGSVTVRMSRGPARILNFEWTNCQIRSLDNSMIATGPGQIALIDDTFTPTHVAAITLGSTTRDVVLPWSFVAYDETFSRILSRNVRMIGVIPVTSTTAGEGSRNSLYTVSGVRHEVNDHAYVDPNRAPDHLVFHTEIRNGIVGETLSWANGGYYFDDELRFVTGDYVSTITQPFYGTQTLKWSVDRLRTRHITDYANWVGNYSYDGGFTWTWAPQSPAGCLSGRFVLKTRAPFTIPNLGDYRVKDSGELSINDGAAIYRAYSSATVPPGLPPTSLTLLSMNVRNVGTFNYDYGLSPDPVREVSTCH